MNKDNKNTQTTMDDVIPIEKRGDHATKKEVQKPTLPVKEKLLPAKAQPGDPDIDKIEILPISKLEAFKSHPFKIIENEDFIKLVESVKENGVLIPAVARPKGDGYELIAGHRRKAVCEKLGIDTMPVIVRNMTDEQSTIFMVDSNVQRENILPSEKAFAYKMKMDAIKRQGQRDTTACAPVEHKSEGIKSRDIIAQEYGESREQVRRYIRLTELNPQLLQMVDEGKIAFRPAVELSYITKAHQKQLLSAMDAEQSTPSLSQAQKMKMYSLDGLLDEARITTLMREQKPNQHECIRIPYEKIKTVIKDDMSPKDIEAFILRAVTDYQRKLQQQRSGATR